MVEILCPHCEEEIELEDEASGEFACPFCEGEFEWNVDENDSSGAGTGFTFDLSSINPIAVGQVALVGISLVFLWMCFTADPLVTATLTDEEMSGGFEYSWGTDTMQMYNIYGINGLGKYTQWIDYLENLNEECVAFTGEKCEGIDGMIEGMEAWDSAGNTYQVFMLIAFILMILMLILRLTSILYEYAVFEMPLGLAVLVNVCGRGAYYLGCGLWFLAIVIHMIMSPGGPATLGLGDGDIASGGYVGTIWFGLVVSLLAPAIHAGLWFVPQDN
tara:strand:- start:53 stop:874 length:822 start_codon:yes stop_codon:yes gene_type:complete